LKCDSTAIVSKVEVRVVEAMAIDVPKVGRVKH